MDYTSIKVLAKELHQPVTSLIALAPQNDPFYCGTERDKTIGLWFAGLWEAFGYAHGVHIRRMHYAIVSQNPRVIMPNGKPYENTEACWQELVQASKCARYLEFVDPGAFVDRRNGVPIDHADYYDQARVEVGVTGGEYEEAARLPDFPEVPHYNLLLNSPQRYHIEIWCEKSTMNDVLSSIAERFGATFQYGMGELSITVALDAIKRFERIGKPVRIFYISDFDPAGACMPVSMSRKVEYFIQKRCLHLDVKLFPLLLTHEQVLKYDRLLPTPIKDSELRKAKFEERYGGGAVELDALEALYPGELKHLLTAEISRYYDNSLQVRVWAEAGRIRQANNEVCEIVVDRYRDELNELEGEYKRIQETVDAMLAQHSERRETLWQAIRSDLVAEMPIIDVDDCPQAVIATDHLHPLYDSSRDYLEQNEAYQVHKGNER